MQIKLLKAYSTGNRKKETKNNLMIQKQEKGKKERRNERCFERHEKEKLKQQQENKMKCLP